MRPGRNAPGEGHDARGGASGDPLHGVTLEAIVRALVDEYGWDGLAARIDVNCFKNDPSVTSSLKFLRRTPWARKRVEELFVSTRSGRRG